MANDNPDAHERGDFRVELVDIGEGVSGDYDPTDPWDRPLLRFYFQRRLTDAERAEGAFSGDGEWEDLEDGSYCTQLPADLGKDDTAAALKLLMDRAYDDISRGSGYKRRLEELSWIDTTWLHPDEA